HPVHVTLRIRQGVGYLRGWSRTRAIEDALREAKLRFGLRIVHYSIQGMHLHLLVEVDDRVALTRGIQGLSVRIARRLDALARRRGKVFSDRYHAHVLRTRRETANALRYVTRNYAHHARENVAPDYVDPCSSACWLRAAPPPEAPVVRPRTWLLREAPRAG